MRVKITVDFYINNLCGDNYLDHAAEGATRPEKIRSMTNELIDSEGLMGIVDDTKGNIIDIVEV